MKTTTTLLAALLCALVARGEAALHSSAESDALSDEAFSQGRPFEIKASSTYHPEMGRNLKRFAKLTANVVLPTVIYSGKTAYDTAGISRMDFRDDGVPFLRSFRDVSPP